jgi:hypothetical protein
VLNTAAWDLEDHSAEPGVPAGQGVVDGNVIPYLPSAAAQRRNNHEHRHTADPNTKCYLPGVPRITYMPYPFQIVQSAKYVVFAYEYNHATRLVYTDGSGHPKDVDFWMGDSRGHWEMNTLVVDVGDLNDQTWFDQAGNFHSDALHVIERYTLTGPNTISYEVTVDDPKVFAKPWKMSMPLYRRLEQGVRLLEYECLAFLQEGVESGK